MISFPPSYPESLNSDKISKRYRHIDKLTTSLRTNVMLHTVGVENTFDKFDVYIACSAPISQLGIY